MRHLGTSVDIYLAQTVPRHTIFIRSRFCVGVSERVGVGLRRRSIAADEADAFPQSQALLIGGSQAKNFKPVIVDFWAEWCGPCRMVGPIVQEIGEEYSENAVVGKLDVDSNPEVTMKYGIRNIPTILFFKNGEVADKQVGAVPKSVLVDKLQALIA